MFNCKVQFQGFNGIPTTPEERIMSFAPELMSKLMRIDWGYIKTLSELGIEPEDVESELWEKVIHAAHLYDEFHVETKFTTYAWSACENRILELIRNAKAAKRAVPTVSIDEFLAAEEVSDEELTEVRRYRKVFGSGFTEELLDSALVHEVLERVTENLSEQDNKILNWTLRGDTQQCIAEKLHMSQPYINGRLKGIRLVVAHELKKEVA